MVRMTQAFNAAEADSIPGATEPVERENLFRLASSVDLLPGDSIVEFGSLFGRSTNCLAQGLSANRTRRVDNLVITYDNFRCARDGFNGPQVIDLAKAAGTAHLIQQDGRTIDFKPVFEHYLKRYIEGGVVRAVQAELSVSDPPPGVIALMHIDSPKFYDEFKAVAFRFLPRTRVGSILVFQDFFYHWSASLIAAISLMINRGLLAVEGSAASSLICRVDREMTLEEMSEIDLMLSDQRSIPQFIQEAIDICRPLKLDRPEIFLPRLYLAKIQHLWESARFPEAAENVVGFFNSGHRMNQAVAYDFVEMLSKGFSVRQIYERDRDI